MENITQVTEFVLLGLTKAPELQVPLFIVFTLIYVITLIGNLGIITVIVLDSRLHIPMYFFLSNLSLVDFCSSSTVTPKILSGLLLGEKVISYNGCAAQMFFFAAFATMECYFLTSMAYDRYVAVCKPLHYSIIMTKSLCVHLAIGCYIIGFVNASVQIGDTFYLSFCKANVVHHFFCDIPAVMTLSCSDRKIAEMILILISSFNVIFAIFVILVSYLFIFVTILKMHSGDGYQKAFSTCTSHLTAVFLFYGAVIIMYLQPSSSHSMDTDKIASLFYTVIIPMLNPLVYSLRNREVKRAFLKVVDKAKFFKG